MLLTADMAEGDRPRAFAHRPGGTALKTTGQDELQQTRELLTAVLDSSLHGMAVFHAVRDDAGRIVDFECVLANPAAARIAGTTAEDLIGVPLTRIIPGVRDTPLWSIYESVVSTGEPKVWEGRFDGGPFHGVFRSSYVRVGDGFACMFEDVTERAQLEEGLRQSQKMEALGRLAGGIAHDFNNVLMAINGYADLVLERLAPGPVRDDVAEIRRAGEQAAAITSQLLAFSRSRGEDTSLEDPSAVLAKMEGLLRRLVGRDVELTTRRSAGPCLVRASRGQLEQVLLNLVVNARDAMPGGGRIELSIAPVAAAEQHEHALDPARSWLALDVRDTGQGMDEQTRARVFEPFFTTKAGGRGTGLGLATVYGIVRRAEGRIVVESRPGRGSRFRVFLPVADGALAAIAAAAPPPPPRPPPPSAPIHRAAAAEGVRRLVARLLASSGHRVLEAADGEAALALVAGREHAIDLLVTDVVMPRLGGLELAERLRRVRAGLPVLYVSGHQRDEVAIGPPRPAGEHMLVKPFTASELVRTVGELLAARRASG